MTIDIATITGLIAAGGIVGLLLNPVISFFKEIFKLNEDPQTITKQRLKVVLSAITSLGGGFLVLMLINQAAINTIQGVIFSGAIVFSAATIVYQTYWKDSKPEAKVEKAAANLVN